MSDTELVSLLTRKLGFGLLGVKFRYAYLSVGCHEPSKYGIIMGLSAVGCTPAGKAIDVNCALLLQDIPVASMRIIKNRSL